MDEKANPIQKSEGAGETGSSNSRALKIILHYQQKNICATIVAQ